MVVEVGDPRGDLDACLGAGAERVAVDAFDLDGGEGGLGDGVIEAGPDSAHRLAHAPPITGGAEQGRGVHVVPFTTHLVASGIDASIGTVGDALDNALMESTIGLYNTELIKPRRPWRTLAQVELATAEWIDWYNHHRLHSALGHRPPAEYESMFYAHTAPDQKSLVTA